MTARRRRPATTPGSPTTPRPSNDSGPAAVDAPSTVDAPPDSPSIADAGDAGSPTSTWVSIAGIRRDTTVELWVGGTMVGSSAISDSLDSYVDDAGTSSSIGGWDRNTSQWWNGYLDAIRVYNRALSQAEIQAL
jgi:hypothetical protein